MPDWLASGFSPAGLFAVLVQQLPGIVWAIRPPQDNPFSDNSGSVLVESLEKTFGIATIVSLVVVLVRFPVPAALRTPLLIAGFVVLALYYGLYVAYYRGITGLPVLLGMAALPPTCFLLVATSQGNVLALLTTLVFGAVLVGLTYSNFGSVASATRS